MTAYATAPEDVATNILTRMASEDISVAWLARRTGIEQDHLQRVLDGHETLTLYLAILIADALETTPPKLAAVPQFA